VALVLLVVSSAAVVVWDEEAANAPADPEGEQLAALTQEQQAGERPPQARNEPARNDAGRGARRDTPGQPSSAAAARANAGAPSSAQRPSSPQLNTQRVNAEQGWGQRDRSLSSANKLASELPNPGRGAQAGARLLQGAERQSAGPSPTTTAPPVESLVQPASVRTTVEPRAERAQLASTRPLRGSHASSGGGREYTVKDGESLWRIAARELGDGERWSDIVALNQLPNPDVVKPGDVLRLPASAASAGSSARARAPETTPRPHAGAREHRVRAGQSLWRIAAAELGDGDRWTEIAELNGLDDPNAIREGDVLRLPAERTSQRTLVAQAADSTSNRRVR